MKRLLLGLALLLSAAVSHAQMAGGVMASGRVITGSAITGSTITATTALNLGDSNVRMQAGATSEWDLYVSSARKFSLQAAQSAAVISSTYAYSWSGGTDPGATGPDLFLWRDAANTLALRNANNPQTFNHYGGNGGFMSVVAFNESLTIAAAATTDSATTIPAGAQIIAVSVRVTTVIPTAATFTVTTATGGTALNTAAVSTAANSTDAGTAAGGATYTSAGTKIRITPNLTPGTATGVVRINGYYRLITPPTS